MINYLGDLYRELHHIKVASDQDGGYEPSLVILNHKHPGKSFIIPLGAMWKYVDCVSYYDDEVTKEADQKEFMNIWIKNRQMLDVHGRLIIWGEVEKQRKEAIENIAACKFAYAFHNGTKVMLCTGYNLAKCMQMFDISPVPQAAAQLLLWIQSRLDDLKNMPLSPEKEDTFVAGEVIVSVDGHKTSKDLTLTETDLVLETNSGL